MDVGILSIMRKKAEEYGIPMWVLYPIVKLESSGNPLAHAKTPKEDSRGLLQVNIKAHPNADPTKLFDPTYNLDYQLPELKRFYDRAVDLGLEGVEVVHYVERYGQRPAWTDKVANSLTKYYQEFTGGKIPVSNSKPNVDNNKDIGVEKVGLFSFGDGLFNEITIVVFKFIIALMIMFALYMSFGSYIPKQLGGGK